jgi:phage tail sheath protein FI
MALPDVFVKVLSAASPRVIPTNTGACFAVGVTTRGPAGKARLVRSLSEALAIFGERIAASPSLYDWVEAFFSEGGGELYFQRVFGNGAKAAELKLKKAAETVLTVEAAALGMLDPGTWGNSLFIVVEQPSGTTFKLKVELESGGVKSVVEESPVFTTTQEAEAWAKTFSNYIRVKAEGAGIPDVLASKTMAGGTAGAAVADADYTLALESFIPELGPGQVCAPGQTTAPRQLAVIAHAVANNRFALLDGTDTPTVATLVAQAQALYVAPNSGRRYAQLLAPWDVIPGLTTTTQRTVPPSARAAAQYAKVDALGNPNQGAAGKRGTAQFVLDLSQPAWTATQREELNAAGVTVSRRRFGNTVQTWGIRTLADQVNDEQWSMAPNVRTIMYYAARAYLIGEEMEFDAIDGFGQEAGKLKGELVAEAQRLYAAGALFGENPSQAFAVNVGPTVNTPTTLAAGKLLAQVSLRVSPITEQVLIYVVKVPITQALT